MEAIKLMISEEQEEMFLKQFYQIATKAIEKAQENAGMTREYLNHVKGHNKMLVLGH